MSREMSMKGSEIHPRPQSSVSVFRLVFTTVVVLSLISLALAIYFATRTNLSAAQQQMLDTCSTCWKLGFGAIVGMIGGKASDNERS